MGTMKPIFAPSGGTLHIPVLTFPQEDMPISLGTDGILFDGAPFPFATVGKWSIEIGPDEITVLRVDIAVRLGELPPQPEPVR